MFITKMELKKNIRLFNNEANKKKSKHDSQSIFEISFFYPLWCWLKNILTF